MSLTYATSPIAHAGLPQTSMVKVGTRRPKRKADRKPVTLQQVRSLIQSAKPHLKYVDGQQTLSMDIAGVVGLISLIPQGSSSQSTRVGVSVRLKHLEFRGCVGSPAAGDPFNNVRLVLVKWYKDAAAVGGVPIDAVFESTFVNTVHAPFAPYTYNQASQMIRNYQVLHDITLAVSPGNGVAPFSFDIPLDCRCSFSGTLGTEAESIENTIFLFAISDSGVVPYPVLSFGTRLWFQDEF
jgi:hypothetical protein